MLLRQAGVISRRQSLDAGLTARQLDRLLRTGEWVRIRPAVYRLAAVPPSAAASLRGSALWLGDRAVLTDVGAGWWWQLVPDPPAKWHFATRAASHRSGVSDIRVSRSFVDPYDQTCRRDIAVVTRPLALLRSALVLEQSQPGQGIALIDRAKQRRWVAVNDLELAFRRNKGTRGTTGMRRLLDRTGDRAHSELERIGVRLLRQAGITGFVVNLRHTLTSGRPVEFDIAFKERRFAIELDGFAYHATPAAHRVDVRRANEVMADGWVIRRFTYSDLLDDPDGFIRVVLEILAS